MAAAADANAMLEPDHAFHRRIAEATGNDLMAYIRDMPSLALRESIKLGSRLPDTHALSLPRHRPSSRHCSTATRWPHTRRPCCNRTRHSSTCRP